MRRLRPLLLPALLVVGAPVLVACGGGAGVSKDAGPAGPTTSAGASADAAADLVALKGDGFSIGLPGKAESSTQTVPTKAGKIKIVLYTATDAAGGTFVVAMNDYPAGTTLDLDGAVKGAAANVQGTVAESRATTFQGNPARDARYTATPQGQPVTIFARVVQKGQKLFQVQYFLPQKDLQQPPPVYDQVLGSVKFD